MIEVPAFAEENEFRKFGSERPGNNYYFPMARYRYAPPATPTAANPAIACRRDWRMEGGPKTDGNDAERVKPFAAASGEATRPCAAARTNII